MAKRNYLVEGLSGAGKSSVYEELIERGYKAITTDRAWKRGTNTWDERKALSELEDLESEVLFVCGSSGNRDRFLRYFDKVFNLRIDDDTMRRRLRERTNNDFGKQPEDLERMLELNRSDEKPAGAVDVDATRPLQQVADEVLRLANCSSLSDSTPPAWSKRGSVTGRSFVVSETVLRMARGTSNDFWEVIGRESATRIEYSWSGDVLATLLPYLDEQRIDLMHSDHGDGVLTSDHRERYLARLDPAAFDGAVLRRYYEDFNEVTAEGVEYAMLDGIAFFRDTLEPLRSELVAVLSIG